MAPTDGPLFNRPAHPAGNAFSRAFLSPVTYARWEQRKGLPRQGFRGDAVHRGALFRNGERPDEVRAEEFAFRPGANRSWPA